MTDETDAAAFDILQAFQSLGNRVEKAVKGQSFSIKVPQKIRPSDRLYRWDESAVATK